MLHEAFPRIRRTVKLAAALLAVVVALFAFSVSAQAQTVYDSIPNPIPANVAESRAIRRRRPLNLGDHIEFASGTSRTLKSVTILMSSWACGSWEVGGQCVTTPGATFAHPITLNIYAADASGAQPVIVTPALLSKSVTFNIPFRPSGDPTCPDVGYGAGFGWRDVSGNMLQRPGDTDHLRLHEWSADRAAR